MPVTYVKDASKVLPTKPKMGTIGKAKRFCDYKKSSHESIPGVGRYNIANYVNLSKAAGTNFETVD